MKKWIRSLFQGSSPDTSSPTGSAPLPESGSSGGAPAATASSGSGSSQGLNFEGVLADLRECIRDLSPDALPVEEIDPQLHLFDAGYVNSTTAADLLIHLENRYEVHVAETDLVGRLRNLDLLAKHIVASVP